VSREVEQGLACFQRRAWKAAHHHLCAADRAGALGPAELERLATTAYLLGRDDEHLGALERAHAGYLAAGQPARAVRCAFWLGLTLMFAGQIGPATGWLARAQRILEQGPETVEQGYLLIPLAQRHAGAGELGPAFETAARAAAIGEAAGELELVAMARHLQGRIRLGQGRVADGLALLDEAMVGVGAGELPPVTTGLIYCSVIDGCLEVYALDRARQWTAGLARWCGDQPDLVAFTGTCLAHRAEVLQLQGAWAEALAEARRACGQLSRLRARSSTALAWYQRGELHRLRGEHAEAEEAYAAASRSGRDPQPGLALLRLAEGRSAAARGGIRRALEATRQDVQRPRLLAACCEIALACDAPDEADRACDELEDIARRLDTAALHAMAAQARGAIQLAGDDPRAALQRLQQAWQAWQEIGAPYPEARVRGLRGLCCRRLGDDDGAVLELRAAHATFEALGATTDAARVAALLTPAPALLPARELAVLRLLASGKTNRAIATALGLSTRTIDRHVSNIFTKLDVPSRAAATAYAYEHDLL
jgi:DNA-binding NarL/FixJ family response regulator